MAYPGAVWKSDEMRQSKSVHLLPELIAVRAGPRSEKLSAFSQVDHEPVGFDKESRNPDTHRGIQTLRHEARERRIISKCETFH